MCAGSKSPVMQPDSNPYIEAAFDSASPRLHTFYSVSILFVGKNTNDTPETALRKADLAHSKSILPSIISEHTFNSYR